MQNEQLFSLVVAGWDQLGHSIDTWESETHGISHEVILERALDKKVLKTQHYENSLAFTPVNASNVEYNEVVPQ